MSCPPDLVNYLVVQVSETPGFENPLTQMLPASAAMFPVNGAYDTPKWVRAKWRRSTDPLDEGPWSNVLPVTFLKLTADEVDAPGTGMVEPPAVPVIRSVLGWTEFIELCLLSNSRGEGCTVGYGVAQLTQNGGSCIYVKNTSSDPTVSIVEAALIIGQPFPQLDCHGDKTIAAGFHPGDVFITGQPIVDVSNYGPYLSAPPVAVTEVPSGQIKYVQVSQAAPDGVDPGNPDYDCLTKRCPEPGDAGYNVIAECINVFDVVRTPSSFNLPGGGNYYVKVNSGIARAFQQYNPATGNFIFPPFLNVTLGTGHFAAFTQVGSVYVRFSTGVSIYQHAVSLGPDLGGIMLTPSTVPATPQLEDYFVFISESPFAANLGAGSWQDAVNNNTLPAGVHLALVERSTNLLVSNLGGAALDPPKTPAEWPNYNQGYYFRVGARRFADLSQSTFVYSSSLSEQAFGRLGTMASLNAALGNGVAETTGSSFWKDPVVTFSDLPLNAVVGDARLVLDENVIYAFVNGEWNRAGVPTMQVAGEILFGVSVVAVGSSRGFRPTVPKGIFNGVLTGWCLQCDTAGNGTTTVDIHKNGTTIFTNQANRPTLTNAQTKSTGSTIDVTAVSSEDDLTLDIDSVPGTVPTKLTAILYFRQDAQAV